LKADRSRRHLHLDIDRQHLDALEGDGGDARHGHSTIS